MDIRITDEGDFVLTDEKIHQVDEDMERYQMALCRIKSIRADWFNDHIGADLEKFLGMPVNTENDTAIRQTIVNALTFDRYFLEEDIFIKILYSKNNRNRAKITVYIKTLNGKGAYTINANLDLVKGFMAVGG